MGRAERGAANAPGSEHARGGPAVIVTTTGPVLAHSLFHGIRTGVGFMTPRPGVAPLMKGTWRLSAHDAGKRTSNIALQSRSMRIGKIRQKTHRIAIENSGLMLYAQCLCF